MSRHQGRSELFDQGVAATGGVPRRIQGGSIGPGRARRRVEGKVEIPERRQLVRVQGPQIADDLQIRGRPSQVPGRGVEGVAQVPGVGGIRILFDQGLQRGFGRRGGSR